MKGIWKIVASVLKKYIIVGIVPLIILAFGFMAFVGVVFILPTMYLQETGILAFFSTHDDEWDVTKDASLKEQYTKLSEKDLGSKEAQMYVPSQFDQAYRYRLEWGRLAAVDRVLGDPINDPEKQSKRKPEPEKHYEALKSKFKWKESTVVVTVKQGQTSTTTTYKVVLLDTVDAYNAFYQLKYSRETDVFTDSTITYDKLISEDIEFYPEEKNRLIQLLKSYDLTKDDIDTVEELAMVYDPDTRKEEVEGALNDIVKLPNDPNEPPIDNLDQNGNYPLPGKYGVDFVLTSSYDYRNDPYSKKKAFHDGVDLWAPKGTPVLASFDGKVMYARFGLKGSGFGGYGNVVLLKHGSFLTMYAHLDSIDPSIKEGGFVKKGVRLGIIGSTGKSTGTHLHWGAYKLSYNAANSFDPLTLIKQ